MLRAKKLKEERQNIIAEMDRLKGGCATLEMVDILLNSKEYLKLSIRYETLSEVSRDILDMRCDEMFEDNEQYTVSLVGYLSTKGSTLADFDKYLDAICDKLGELRFRPTTQDSPIAPDTGYRECMLTAYAQLNTLEKTLR